MRDTNQLREALIEDLMALRAGNLARPEARARAYLARQIIDTVKVEAIAAAMNTDTYRAVELLPANNTAAIAAE
jgi:hypothetical protein